jgi:ribonuclease HI
MKGVTIFTDGSCIGNPGPGGWACILRYGQRERVLQGGETKTTNNRMELLAAIRGLQVLTETCKVTVITDSLYLQQGMMMYLQRWRRRNWLNSRGEAIANRDLWEQLVTAARRHETVWRWVRGHGSDPDQDRCDELAQQCARSVASRRRMAERVA